MKTIFREISPRKEESGTIQQTKPLFQEYQIPAVIERQIHVMPSRDKREEIAGLLGCGGGGSNPYCRTGRTETEREGEREREQERSRERERERERGVGV